MSEVSDVADMSLRQIVMTAMLTRADQVAAEMEMFVTPDTTVTITAIRVPGRSQRDGE